MKTLLLTTQIIFTIFLAAAIGAGISYSPLAIAEWQKLIGCTIVFLLGLTLKTSGEQALSDLLTTMREELNLERDVAAADKLQFVHKLVKEWHNEPSPEMGDWVAEQLYNKFATELSLNPVDRTPILGKEPHERR